MENLMNFIAANNLIEEGDRVGVAVSGGQDSMALLHYLNSNKDALGIQIVAINVNHKLRKESDKESAFVAKYCKENDIQLARHSVDVNQYVIDNKTTIENAARECRYAAFEKTAKKEKLDKIALGHHLADQAETVLLHIFRGCGVSGAKGMSLKRGIYIRPLLSTEKTEVNKYVYLNQVPYVNDSSNEDSRFSRNFLRNQVMPLIKTEWRGVEKSLVSFAQSCAEDDEYINYNLNPATVSLSSGLCRVPLNYFSYKPAIANRIVRLALTNLNAKVDIERKHIEAIKELTKKENGSKIDLPNNLIAIKEYEFITLMIKLPPAEKKEWKFKVGRLNIPHYGMIITSKTISFRNKEAYLVMDEEKIVARKTMWRFMQEGDTFTKIGGITKKLNAYFAEKKIPNRLRTEIPVLAEGSKILAVAGHDISEDVKLDDTTIEAYLIEIVKE